MQLEDRVTINTPEGLDLELQLAGVGSRFMAGCVDLFLQLVIVAVIAVLLHSVVGGGGVAAALDVITFFIVLYAYDVLFEVLAGGRTPGKRLVHLRVVRASGVPVDLPASALRNLLRVIDGFAFLYLPGLICVLATRRNQRIGDLAAGTLVIRDAPRPKRARAAAPAPGPATSPVGPGAAPALPALADVSAVTPDEIATVRRFLERRTTIAPGPRQQLAYRLEQGLRPKVSGLPEGGGPERFLETLASLKARV